MRLIKRNQRELFDYFYERNNSKISQRLQQVFKIIKKKPTILELVLGDLRRGLKDPLGGKQGLTAQQVLGFAIVKIWEGSSYEKTRDRIVDSMGLASHIGFLSSPIPQSKAFMKAINKLQAETLKQINELIIEVAKDFGKEKGNKLRLDCTAVETNIHYPSDSRLLVDVIRVLTRTSKKILKCCDKHNFKFPNRNKTARKNLRDVKEARRGKNAQQRRLQAYKKLISLTIEVINLCDKLKEESEKNSHDLEIFGLIKEMEHFQNLGKKVVNQTVRRVLQGESVPRAEKIVSIFEEHTDIIVRGKERKDVEFGHKLFLCEGKSGLITDYEVLDGNPGDCPLLPKALEEHKERFEKYPQVLSGDRGFHSQANITFCRERGVKTISIPKKGYKDKKQKELEKTRQFKQGQKFRNGIEGRISVLKLNYGLDRCIFKGRHGFDRLIGLAILAHNLKKLAILLEKKNRKKKVA